MNIQKNIDDLDTVIGKLTDYQRILSNSPGFSPQVNQYFLEAWERLLQLKFCLFEISQLYKEADAGNMIKNPIWKTKFYTESFYFFAWRAQKVLKKLPGLKQLECKGLRIGRNSLIEHPEDTKYPQNPQTAGAAFNFKSPFGPIIRPPIHDPNNMDEGLFINVKEFTDKLTALLDRQIEKV